jgi:hypothetical protein
LGITKLMRRFDFPLPIDEVLDPLAAALARTPC